MRRGRVLAITAAAAALAAAWWLRAPGIALLPVLVFGLHQIGRRDATGTWVVLASVLLTILAVLALLLVGLGLIHRLLSG